MKISTLIIVGLALLVLPVSAQGDFSLTPRAGLNMAAITPTGGSIKPGLNFGASSDYMFNSKWGMEFGVFYSMQGVAFRPDDQKSLNTSHDYLVFPILGKLYLNDLYGETQGLNVFAGGQLELKALVDKVGYTTGYEGQLMPDDINKVLGISAVAGVGYLLPTGLMFSANLNFGLTNITNDKFQAHTTGSTKTVEVTRDKAYRNIVFQLNFGYRFSLPKRYKLPADTSFDFLP
jgi:hypothetical protein